MRTRSKKVGVLKYLIAHMKKKHLVDGQARLALVVVATLPKCVSCEDSQSQPLVPASMDESEESQAHIHIVRLFYLLHQLRHTIIHPTHHWSGQAAGFPNKADDDCTKEEIEERIDLEEAVVFL